MATCHCKLFKESHILRQTKIVLMGEYFLRSKHSSEGTKFQAFQRILKSYFQKSQTPDYHATEQLPLPSNVKDLASEKLKFSPYRSRDISGSFISSTLPHFKDCTLDVAPLNDERIECYDYSGTINLSSVMQTNVPFPFVSRGKPIYLNISGGKWEQEAKYVSEDLNNAHWANAKQFHLRSTGNFTLDLKKGGKNSYLFPVINQICSNTHLPVFSTSKNQFKNYSTEKNKAQVTANLNKENSVNDLPQLSYKEKLKAVIKDYGAVVIVFHVGISLLSLGCCYVIIASGIDLSAVFKEFGVNEGAATAGVAAHFVLAYAVHKSLAPGRVAITLIAVPFIVRKLRKIGLLKIPSNKF